MALLKERHAELAYHDPHVPELMLGKFPMVSQGDEAIASSGIKHYDCVVILTDHSDYDFPSIIQSAQLVVDTRNASKGVSCEGNKLYRL